MIMQAITSAVLLLSLGSVQAAKDDSYYKPGTGNPNVYQTMYWKDAENILADLGQFQTLYVEFQHCAWTWMNYGSNADEESVDENDYWYMGSVPPFGANVAFSLYGALAGQQFQGCNSNTFINSFYTKSGFSDFVYAMAYAGVSSFNKYDFSGYSSECQGYYGVGCDYTNGFAVHSYSTQECNPEYYSGVKDNMQYLNQAMQSAQCVKIYDKSSGKNWNGYNYTVYGTPLELLSNSQACFYQNFWSPDGECPDPYNKIQYYQQNFNRGIVKSKKTDPFEQYTLQMVESEKLTSYGTTMLVAAAFVLLVGCLMPSIGRSFCPRAKGRPSKEIQLSTPATDFVAPDIYVVDTPKPPTTQAPAPVLSSTPVEDDRMIMEDAEILRSRSFEDEPVATAPVPTQSTAPRPAPSKQNSGYKMKLRGMFGKK